ncbi:MAG: glycine cleavage system aminomethyltransferase GcvT [Chloroflexi bacterium]|nr:MAG: glycine cleavage system aminomethyltransferase GcvT [Chloroflexota bacterium]
MQRTALYEEHLTLGARMVDFAGWEMPVQYVGVIEEHRAVRTGAGLFDLGHMGEIRVSGPGAGAALDYALVSTPSALVVGRAQYSMIVNEAGGILDDLVVYRIGDEEWLVVANASNRVVVAAALRERVGGSATVVDESDNTSMIAIQGVTSEEILGSLIAEKERPVFRALRNYSVATMHLEVSGAAITALIARTGYTGEVGYEIYVENAHAVALWRALLAAGSTISNGTPFQAIGLGARDTLRLEAGMPLYGNELRQDLTPFDVGLGRVVKLDKPDGFVGSGALAARSARGERFGRVLIGLRVTGRGIARHGYEVRRPGGATLGLITSGTHSPSLGYPIALADLDAEAAPFTPGEPLEVLIRGEGVAAEVIGVPFILKRSTEGRAQAAHQQGG